MHWSAAPGQTSSAVGQYPHKEVAYTGGAQSAKCRIVLSSGPHMGTCIGISMAPHVGTSMAPHIGTSMGTVFAPVWHIFDCDMPCIAVSGRHSQAEAEAV